MILMKPIEEEDPVRRAFKKWFEKTFCHVVPQLTQEKAWAFRELIWTAYLQGAADTIEVFRTEKISK